MGESHKGVRRLRSRCVRGASEMPSRSKNLKKPLFPVICSTRWNSFVFLILVNSISGSAGVPLRRVHKSACADPGNQYHSGIWARVLAAGVCKLSDRSFWDSVAAFLFLGFGGYVPPFGVRWLLAERSGSWCIKKKQIVFYISSPKFKAPSC